MPAPAAVVNGRDWTKSSRSGRGVNRYGRASGSTGGSGWYTGAWASRCPSSGATATASTSRAARSGSASARRAPSCPSAPSGSAPRSRRAGARSSTPSRTPTTPLLAVHDPRAARLPGHRLGRLGGGGADRGPRPGPGRPLPLPPPRPARRSSSRAVPAAPAARAGRFAYDTMTLIGPGTWEAARAAVDVALTAADLVLAGEPRRLRAAAARRATTRPARRSAAPAT